MRKEGRSGRIGPAVVVITIAVIGFGAAPAGEGTASTGRATGRSAPVWREFVELLRSGPFPADRVRPYREELREPLLRFLDTMRNEADWAEWTEDPDRFPADHQVHFLIDLTFGGETATYCFSFALEEDRWFIQHLETITLRLDGIGPPPVSVFPDLPEPTKAWMRAELRVSREVSLYNRLAAEKGHEQALRWFLDGAGYALAARTWVPFVEPGRAFVLYLCWEQSRLRGNDLTLEELTDEEALVRVTPLRLLLYERTAHLRQQIPSDRYRELFESRWRNRATNAGWEIDFTYDGAECLLRLRRHGVAPE